MSSGGADIQFRGAISNGATQRGEYMTKPERTKEVTEFRRTHFIMGKHPNTNLSQQRFVTLLRPGLTGGPQHQSGSKQKSQQTNFRIGLKYDPQSQFSTSYQK